MRVSGVFVWGACGPPACTNNGTDQSRWGDGAYLTDSQFEDFNYEFSQWVYLAMNGQPISYSDNSFHPDHIYTVQVKGSGSPLQFQIMDCDGCYGDNAGALTVEIFQGSTAPAATVVNSYNNSSPVHFEQRSISTPGDWPASTWGEVRYGDPATTGSSDTIAHWGDTLTTWAMLVNYWWAQSGAHTDPLQLNNALQNPSDGETAVGFDSSLNVDPSRVTSYANSTGWQKFVLGEAAFSPSQLDQLLNNEIPVLLTVSLGGQPHTVLAVGHTLQPDGKETWYIYDPWSPDTFLSPPTLGSYANQATWMQWLAPSSSTALNSVLAYASGADMVLTDPQGHKDGTDPRTGTSYNQIPNSAVHDFQESDPSGQLTSPPPVHTVVLAQPVPGAYGFDIIGTANGSDQYGYMLFNNQDEAVGGMAGSGQTSKNADNSQPFRYLTTELSNYSVSQGQQITVSGQGFLPHEAVKVYLNGSAGTLEGSTTADSTGAFGNGTAVTFTVPKIPTNRYTVTSVGQTSNGQTYSTFQLVPTLSLSQSSVVPGEQITVNGTGYGANETVAIFWNCPFSWRNSTNTLATPAADASGNFQQDIQIPSDATAGLRYAVGVLGTVSYDFLAEYVTIKGGGSTTPAGIWSWGANWAGQLGNGNTVNTGNPGVPSVVHVDGLSGVTAIAAGENHALALTSDGSVWGWGWNYFGQATGNFSGSSMVENPELVIAGGSGVNTVQVAAGWDFSLALGSDGRVTAWGDNEVGQLGIGTTSSAPGAAPGLVLDAEDPSGYLTNVVEVAATDSTAFALKSDGTVRVWGSGCTGLLGPAYGTSCPSATLPTIARDPSDPTGFLTHVVSISAGGGYVMVTKSDGTVWNWGEDFNQELARPGTDPCNGVPHGCDYTARQVAGLANVAATAAGAAAFALINGGVRAWGFDADGEAGTGTFVTSGCYCVPSPSPVSGVGGAGTLNSVAAISGGRTGGLALLQNNTVVDWGSNWDGELGIPPDYSQQCPCTASPIAVPGLNSIASIASGDYSNYALAGPTLTTPDPAVNGSTVPLSGHGYVGGEQITFYLDTSGTGTSPARRPVTPRNSLPPGVHPAGSLPATQPRDGSIGTATAGQDGSLNASVTLPAGTAGTHRIIAVGNSGSTSSLLVQAPPASTSATLTLNSGWTLMTLPIPAGINTLGSLASFIQHALGSKSVQALATYQQGRFQTYIPGYTLGGGTQINGGTGIWVRSTGGNVPLTGVPEETPDRVVLHPGWNLVGAAYTQGNSASSIAAQVDCGLSEVAAYHNHKYVVWTPSSSTDLQLSSQDGFWLECSGDDAWIPAPSSYFTYQILTALAFGGYQGSAIVTRNGQTVFAGGLGLADEANNIPNTPDTKFRIAGLTELFTSTAIMQLKDQGKLSLQDSVCKYVPTCPTAWQPITLQELLDESAGIPGIFSGEVPQYNPDDPQTPLQTITMLEGLPLLFSPGTQISLSYSDYEILGYIVQSVSGESYTTYVQNNIFNRASMSNSGIVQDGATVSGLAIGYENGQPQGPAEGTYDDSNLFSWAGAYSTIGDVLQWYTALRGGKLLSAASVSDLLSAHSPSASWGGRGYGLWSETNYCGSDVHPAKEASDYIPGATADFLTFPDDHLTMVLLNNESSNGAYNFTFPIAQNLIPGLCG